MKKLSKGRKIGIGVCILALVALVFIAAEYLKGDAVNGAGLGVLTALIVSSSMSEDNNKEDGDIEADLEKQEDLFTPLEIAEKEEDYRAEEVYLDYDFEEVTGVDKSNLDALITPDKQTTVEQASLSFDITYNNADFKMDTVEVQIEEVIDTSNINGEAIRKVINMIAKENDYTSVHVDDNEEPVAESVDAGYEDSYCAYTVFDEKDIWLIECCGSRVAYSKMVF